MDPITYPKLTIPGKGTFTVKFGLGASFILESELGMDAAAFAKAIKGWIPVTDEDGTILKPGSVTRTFLFKVLSACIWNEARLTPQELAFAFDDDMAAPVTIARAIVEAFAKMPRPAKSPLQVPSACQEHPPLN